LAREESAFSGFAVKRVYSVYILASRSRSLYTGVTGAIEYRMLQHRLGLVPGFTTRYRIFRLVHVEHFGDIRDAIAREKEIKGWRRQKKIRLIEQQNPAWQDLSAKFPHKYQHLELPQQIPPRSPNPRDRGRDDSQKRTSHQDSKNRPGVIPNPAAHSADRGEGSAFSSSTARRPPK
jgi:putative endonuclease